MNVLILGAGYVGLTTGLCLTQKDHRVLCYDIDKEKINSLRNGKLPIYEPGLEEIFNTAVKKGLFEPVSDLGYAVQNSELSFIAVGTPMLQDKGIDLSYVKNAARQIGAQLRNKQAYHVVVVKSTVVPSTSEKIIKEELEQASGKRCGKHFGLCVNPEFLREGSAVKDFNEPDRIILGCFAQKEKEVLTQLYSGYNAPFVYTNLSTAEMIKYASNSLLATLISLSNEFANLCEIVPNVDVEKVLDAVKLDYRFNPILAGNKRLNPDFLVYLKAGCGFGGSCFPKDINAIIRFAESNKYNPRLLRSVMLINENRAAHMIELLKSQLGSLKGKKVGILGTAFKPSTDDIRESPALYIIGHLLRENANVFAHDPMAIANSKKYFGGQSSKIRFFEDLSLFLQQNLDAVMLVTAWPEYAKIAFDKGFSKPIVLLDARGVYDKGKLPENVKYVAVGFVEKN